MYSDTEFVVKTMCSVILVGVCLCSLGIGAVIGILCIIRRSGDDGH